MTSRNVDEIIKQMKDDVAQPPSEDKRARYEKHVAELAAESPEDILMRYGLHAGDAKDVLVQLANLGIGFKFGDIKLYPESEERATAEEFRADIRQYPAAPPTAPEE